MSSFDMAHWFDITLVALGSFMILFRVVIRIKAIRRAVEASVLLVAGASLSLFAPLMPAIAGSLYAVPTMLAIGLMLGSPLCGGATYAFSFFIMVETLGVGLFSIVWHLGLCGATGDSAGRVHPVLMTVVVLSCVCATAPQCTNKLFEPVLCPLLGALLVTLGGAGLAPERQGLSANGLFAPVPCNDVEGTTHTLAAWGTLFLLGALLSQLLRKATDQQKQEGAGNDLGKGFIEKQREEDAEAGAGGINKKDLDNNLGRHNVLTNAIFADEGTDQSHLTESERGLVNICRTDEFERDRFLWGGGLW